MRAHHLGENLVGGLVGDRLEAPALLECLDLRVEDFRILVRAPRAPLVGLFCQFALLPALTFLLTLVLQPPPSVALGMMLVAANVSMSPLTL